MRKMVVLNVADPVMLGGECKLLNCKALGSMHPDCGIPTSVTKVSGGRSLSTATTSDKVATRMDTVEEVTSESPEVGRLKHPR